MNLFVTSIVFLSSFAITTALIKKHEATPVQQVVSTTPTLAVNTNLIKIKNDAKDSSFEEAKQITRLSLNDSNTIVIEGEIGDSAVLIANLITKKAHSNKEIYILINSPGGSVFDGALIVSAIQASPVPVKTVCLQLCASMASIIHSYGTERYMLDRSILMFHDAAGGLQGTVPQMLTRLNFINRYTSKMDANIARRAGLSVEEFLNRIKAELWLDAEDSVAQHFADGIVSLSYSNSEKLLTSSSKKNKLQELINVGY